MGYFQLPKGSKTNTPVLSGSTGNEAIIICWVVCPGLGRMSNDWRIKNYHVVNVKMKGSQQCLDKDERNAVTQNSVYQTTMSGISL